MTIIFDIKQCSLVPSSLDPRLYPTILRGVFRTTYPENGRFNRMAKSRKGNKPTVDLFFCPLDADLFTVRV